MVILSAGMQKSGSAYLYNILNDLLISNGDPDARKIKEKYALDDIMQWHNNNVGAAEKRVLLRLLKISRKEGQFAVKTHEGATTFMRILLLLNKIKVIYVYRDPRDVLLSAIDHGKKILAEGGNHTFAKMVAFDDAFANVKEWIEIWKEYHSMSRVLKIRYEDLMSNPHAELRKVQQYLGINISQEETERILHTYDKNNKQANMTGLHFNKGESERYKRELTEEQLDRFRKDLGSELTLMGYSL